MCKVINLYLYRLQKEIEAAIQKERNITPPLRDPEQQSNDFSFCYGEHFCSELIPAIYKSKG